MKIQPHASNQEELSKVEAELKKYLQVEEDFCSLKARIKWFYDVDKTTIFFLLYVKGKWKKLHIGQILCDQAITLQTNEKIDQVVVGFYGEQFHANILETDYVQIDQIPKSISDEKNEAMSRLPSR